MFELPLLALRFELNLLLAKEKVTQRMRCTEDDPPNIKLAILIVNNRNVFVIFVKLGKRSFFSLHICSIKDTNPSAVKHLTLIIWLIMTFHYLTNHDSSEHSKSFKKVQWYWVRGPLSHSYACTLLLSIRLGNIEVYILTKVTLLYIINFPFLLMIEVQYCFTPNRWLGIKWNLLREREFMNFISLQ